MKSPISYRCYDLVNDLISTLEMSIADVNADYLGVQRIILMENAGRGLAEFIWKISMEEAISNIIIIAGKGGNGGDGMVAARHLADKAKVSLYLIGEKQDIKKVSTRKNWKILENMPHSLKLNEVKDSKDLKKIKFNKKSVIVDALFGTGVHGEITGLYSKVITTINSYRNKGALIICVDTPSGIDPNTGKKANVFIKGHYTTVFHKQKQGLTEENSGKIKIVPIGIPPEAEFVIGPGDLLASSTKEKWVKKGDKGKVLVIGGNEKYSGAPALAGMGALQAGSDLVTIVAPDKITPAIRSYTPEFIVQSYPSPHLTVETLPYQLMEEYDSIVLGPGLGRHPETQKAVEVTLEFVKKHEIPIVIDADALYLISQSHLYENVILTPHGGEFAVLTGTSLPVGFTSFSERLKTVLNITKNTPAVWLVKGPWDIISSPEKYKINKSGVPEMSRGGTGDILAGLTGSFINNTEDLCYAASIAAFINGKAGELTRNDFSSMNLLAKIPTAIRTSWDFILAD
jgi:NAD(P)H-hydrate epimerase